jgi:drug/metabolite transporter (DMT)-like permease
MCASRRGRRGSTRRERAWRRPRGARPGDGPVKVLGLLGLVGLAALAAFGNALYALGQRQAAGSALVVAAASAAVAALLAMVAALASLPDPGAAAATVLRLHWRALLLSGTGLFLTYLGFNLLYTRYGAAAYVVYAALAILTTSLGVGVWLQREPLNRFQLLAIVLAVGAVIAYGYGRTRS